MTDYPELERNLERPGNEAWAALYDPTVSKDVAWPLFLQYRAEQVRMQPIQRAELKARLVDGLKRKVRDGT
jgi:hypothetical protein